MLELERGLNEEQIRVVCKQMFEVIINCTVLLMVQCPELSFYFYTCNRVPCNYCEIKEDNF